jgi:hypothetical protein
MSQLFEGYNLDCVLDIENTDQNRFESNRRVNEKPNRHSTAQDAITLDVSGIAVMVKIPGLVVLA